MNVQLESIVEIVHSSQNTLKTVYRLQPNGVRIIVHKFMTGIIAYFQLQLIFLSYIFNFTFLEIRPLQKTLFGAAIMFSQYWNS